MAELPNTVITDNDIYTREIPHCGLYRIAVYATSDDYDSGTVTISQDDGLAYTNFDGISASARDTVYLSKGTLTVTVADVVGASAQIYVKVEAVHNLAIPSSVRT